MPATILRPYALMFRNHYRKATDSWQGIKRDLLIFFVTFLIILCIYWGFRMILLSLQNDVLFREIIPSKLIELLLFSFFALQIVSSAIAAVGNIYTANNMSLFLAAPVSNTRLYFAKLLEILFETTFMFILFGCPVVVAYERTLPMKPGFALAAFLVVLPFSLIPAGIGIAFATLFVRLAALLWRRGLFLFIAIAAMLAWGVRSLLQILNEVQLERGGSNAIVQMIGLFENPNPWWSPSRWCSDLLSYFITGQVEFAALKIGLLVLTSAASLALGFLAFDTFMLSVRSLAGAQEKADHERGASRASADPVRKILELFALPLPLDQQTRAIMLKDLTSLARDRAQSLQMLMYLGIALSYLMIIKFMGAAMNLEPIALQVWWSVLAGINVLFAGFIVTALMTRLVYPSISLEGKAFWILVSAPIHIRRLILAKFWCWLPLTICISSSLLIAGAMIVYPTPLVVGMTLFIGLCMSIGCTGLATGIGSMFASFEWESPSQISAGFGTLVLLLTSLVLVIVTSVPATALSFLAITPVARNLIGPWWTFAAMVFGMSLVLGINVAVAMAACSRGARSLTAKTIL